MTDLWFNPDEQFIGAIGPTTLRELADEVFNDDSILPALGFDDDVDVTVDDVENALDFLGVRHLDVNDDVLREDTWDDTAVHEAGPGDEPRTGTTRVLGVHI